MSDKGFGIDSTALPDEDDTRSWESCVYHTASTTRLTVAEAHLVMQRYRTCLRHECARKQAAWDVLVEARRITPRKGRTR